MTADSSPLGFSGQAIQTELRRLLAVALVERGWIDPDKAAEVAGVHRSELPAMLERYAVASSSREPRVGGAQ